MVRELQFRVVPEIAGQEEALKAHISETLKINIQEIRHIEILSRSIDARQRIVYFNLKVLVFIREDFVEKPIILPDFPNVSRSREVIVIGAGPAGLFASLQLILSGFKPVLLERGKDVMKRPFDLKEINVHHNVNEDSNYCFGEGGAGTYSDGKLYTRSKKRGNVRQILELLVGFGANKDILVEAHPHIGTNKLPKIVKSIREKIVEMGGEVHFEKRVTDFLLNGNQIQGVLTKDGDKFHSKNVILATGHSARDIFELLYRKGIELKLKPIAVGVRVEHRQSLIDSIQYGCEVRNPYLPPSPYSITKQVDGRGVYSFCMCPGGVIAACATKPEEIVTNGWSSSKRARPSANSGIVVELKMEDFKSFSKYGPLAAMEFQKEIEQKAWVAGGRTQKAPAQKLVDFVEGKASSNLPKTSYAPGITSVVLREILPDFVYQSLQKGFREFDRIRKGYLTNEAVVHAPETRTSSPVCIPRDSRTLRHIRIQGLYPCGEGAGYAGGIVSAAMDGIRSANACVSSIG
ncbi:NAD(P)/FAD-dependent oxidoreductase [Leptospira borgpetersenii]|uniref:FAD-dependent dehydrogenase n=1 Tax=Leptospira borgpetersenii serovar Hardjo-bovis (strain JB197) TaxID=355277 RepID=Q04NP6_LEPBJ|nr:FAD-dependent dehydrogenase [Leptospira borgpetersenii]ABJ77474.1 FAD-dependent dehydrogenase [Leptospira borgpetersenii serovar Hardjo-bovis str. JB197]AMX72725.1 FAD-dependent dehydrogenase [Leptospira borgpetersenii serovar Hardjo]TQE56908.1 FAD-binding protein [Leptospira borgpetersenii]